MAVLTKDQFNNLAQVVDEIVQYNSLSEASTLSGSIKETIKQGGLSADVESILQHCLVQLSYVRFFAISDTELVYLLSHNIDDSYGIPDFDLIQKFGERFGLIQFPEDQAEFLNKVLPALESNDEKVGKNPLTVNGRELPQTVANWIALYNAMPSKHSLRSQLDVVEFLSKNGSSLSEKEKLMMNEVLKLYNGTKNWLTKYNSVPELTENDDIPDGLILDLVYGKEEGIDERLAAASAVRQVPPQSMSVDGLKPQPVRSTVPPQPVSVASASEAQATTPEQVAEELRRGPVNPGTAKRLQELLHKNEAQETAQPTPPVATTPPQSDAIDTKLEELKKRLNQNE